LFKGIEEDRVGELGGNHLPRRGKGYKEGFGLDQKKSRLKENEPESKSSVVENFHVLKDYVNNLTLLEI